MRDSTQGGLWEQVAGGLRRLLGGSWPPDERPFAMLLDLLVWGGKLHADVRELEAGAPTTSFGEPQAEEERLIRQELEAARTDLPDFERALVDAWRRSAGATTEVSYDAADPQQDRAADVLIRYLVTTRTASVRSEERQPRGYVYHVSVYWDTLFALAAHLDVALQPALESAASAGAGE